MALRSLTNGKLTKIVSLSIILSICADINNSYLLRLGHYFKELAGIRIS